MDLGRPIYMNIIEIYVLFGAREKALAIHFLDSLCPDRSPLAEEYPFPQYAYDPFCVFESDLDLIDKLIQNKNETYSLYWRGCDYINEVMLFFTKDAEMIAGVVTDASFATEELFARVAKNTNGKYGYIDFESPPPEHSSDLIKICKDSTFIKLYDGKIILPK